jgi:hypothetical protein
MDSCQCSNMKRSWLDTRDSEEDQRTSCMGKDEKTIHFG